MRRWVLAAVVALLVTGAGVTAGTLLLGEDDGSSDSPDFSTTPLESFDTTTLTVPRAGFCDDVDPRQVEAALGGEPAEAAAYDNGDEVALSDGVTDVVHEFGCSWSGDDGAEARAWVFAPPVGQEQADRLVRAAERTKDCQASATPAYGAPSVGLLCRDEAGGRASYRGLFGDAWLACEVSNRDPAVSGAELLRRTGSWCVGVALAAAR